MLIPKEVETHAADARRQRDREVKVGTFWAPDNGGKVSSNGEDESK